jgi:peptidoglycan/xylan/chitin deacetylase (PgdA/CDA1 family)
VAIRRFPTLPAVGVLAVSIVLSGYALGRVGGPAAHPTRQSVAEPSPSDAAGRPPASPAAPAALASPATVKAQARHTAVLLANAVPVTGPGHPPLRPDRGGPYGSRRTTGTPEVALTFDDGPDPSYTPQVLALLRRYHVHATFCLIGQNVVSFPGLVREIYREGHTLCNHSWDHDIGLAFHSAAYIRANLQRATDAIRRAAPGSRVSYYRQPGGRWSRTIVAVAAALGMTSLHWEVDPQDWRRPGAGRIISTVISWSRPGAIVLLHDGGGVRRGTVAALGSILPNLTRRFRLCAFPPGIDAPRGSVEQMPLRPGELELTMRPKLRYAP